MTEKKKKGSKIPNEASKASLTSYDGLNQIVTRGSNIQANQNLKQLMKMNKKKKKRAGGVNELHCRYATENCVLVIGGLPNQHFVLIFYIWLKLLLSR